MVSTRALSGSVKSTKFESEPIAADSRQFKMETSRAFLLPIIAIVAALTAYGRHSALAEDKGQWNAYRLSNEQKAWFKTVRDSLGNTCCDGADGYPVAYEMRDNKYWVHFRGEWLEVDERALKRQPNPIGEAVAWFYFYNGNLTVRCFVPGPGG
jgi:hypothetical protein